MISLGCWAHVRRKFVEALAVNPTSIAQEMVDKIGLLYDLKKGFKEERLSLTDIAQERYKKSLPILQDI